MAWYAIYETLSGRIESVGESESLPVIAGRTALLLVGEPNQGPDGVMWDETTRLFIARPPKVLIDRLQDILTHIDYADFMTAYNSLNAANKTRIRNGFILLLGRHRWRNVDDPVRLE